MTSIEFLYVVINLEFKYYPSRENLFPLKMSCNSESDQHETQVLGPRCRILTLGGTPTKTSVKR